MAKSLEMRALVRDDANGDRIEVCEDGDGLGLIEIRSVSDDGTIHARVNFEEDAAALIIEGIQRVLQYRETKRGAP